MFDTTAPDAELLADLTASIVSAYVSRNSVSPAELPALISATYDALHRLSKPVVEPQPVEVLKPAVPIKKSVTADFITSLEDGRQYKTLKRHLAGLGMTPDQYREKWNLPSDYPMVAPNYASMRSDLAKSLGLGRKPKDVLAAEPAPVIEEPAPIEEPVVVEEPAPAAAAKPKRRKLGLKF